MIVFQLYGELGAKYGKEFKLHVKTVREGIALLAANFKDFKQHLIDSDTRLAGYEVWANDESLAATENDFKLQREGAVVKIIPVAKGAGANGRIIAGVVLVIVGVLLNVYGGGSGSPVIMAGIGLIAGGIAEKLAPKPKTNPEKDDINDAKSYIFSGPVNSTKQGRPVAIGYGKMIVGSNVISASITTTDIPV
jgi:predicted phage tail protein